MSFCRNYVDIDECSAGTDNCNANAICDNSLGGFNCQCDFGFSGNGINCEGENLL